MLCSLAGTLNHCQFNCSASSAHQLGRTLKAKCSRKCAVPFVLSVSARDPASIHTPTVEVWAHGECSVAIYYLSIHLPLSPCPSARSRLHTVRPLERVVDSVLTPFLLVLRGVAKPLVKGDRELRAVRLRRLWERLRANRREAITAACIEGGSLEEEEEEMRWWW